MTVDELLASSCPHGVLLGECGELWCRSRVEDLLDSGHQYALPDKEN